MATVLATRWALRRRPGCVAWAHAQVADDQWQAGPSALLNFQEFPNWFKWPLQKIEKGVFLALKNYEKFCDDRFDQWEQRFLLVELQNRNRFWIKNSESFWNLNVIWILKGFKPFDKNPRNSQKLCLAKTYTNIILDHITCKVNSHVPLQVALWILREKLKGVEFASGLMTWIRVKPLINTRGITV
jgi:hypothetical protein